MKLGASKASALKLRALKLRASKASALKLGASKASALKLRALKLRALKPWRRVRAGGGVVWRRRAGDGPVEVILVHRPRYDDWSLPKGKVDGAEKEQAAAIREVEEETGLRCDVGPELHRSRYFDSKGRYKTVRYWAMRPVGGEFVPSKEVDQVRWLTPAEASALVSYGRDRRVLRSFHPKGL